MLLGTPAGEIEALRNAGRELAGRRDRPRMLLLGAGDEGNLLVWRADDEAVHDMLLPLADVQVVDTTGAGDALVAGLTAALLAGDEPASAAQVGVAAAAATVARQGGRPQLTPDLLDLPVAADR
jgi:ribokinase